MSSRSFLGWDAARPVAGRRSGEVVAVRLEVNGSAALLAATHLRDRAAAIRVRADDGAALAEGLQEARLRAAAGGLGEVAADVLELAALGVALLAEKVRAGVALYDAVERGLAGAAPGRHQ